MNQNESLQEILDRLDRIERKIDDVHRDTHEVKTNGTIGRQFLIALFGNIVGDAITFPEVINFNRR